jgi:hypothetical protein
MNLTRLPTPDVYPLEADLREISVSDELIDDLVSEVLSVRFVAELCRTVLPTSFFTVG